MKQRIKIILIFLFIYTGISAQDFFISGGNILSGMVCGNGQVYTWGYNYIKIGGTTFRTLGNGSVNNIESSPLQVTLPVGVTVKQLDAGSGAFYLALTCTNKVLAWGDNQNSQLGNTTYPNTTGTRVVNTPIYVMAGETDATPTNDLQNVTYVSGGNLCSYAIMNDGKLIGWGENSAYELGDGTTTDRTRPIYIKTAAATPITNVIQVEAGDFCAYALVDTDGDGIGTVYSWGAGADKQLGQIAVTSSPYAATVKYTDGTALSNIVSISAGDKVCYAIDVNGYVWCWGDGSWDGLTGQGVQVDHAEPRRVLGGATGDTYLKAKAVGGGQGYGMAITLDGKAVSWGNNDVNGVGGALGDGTTTRQMLPTYIKTAAGTPITNCAFISDGDTWGYITKTDNTIWTWGYNIHGELGIGNIINQLYAVQFTPACTYPDPTPKVNLPEDFCSCSPISYSIDPAFGRTTNYTYTWYKDGSIISGATSPTYTATATGLYRVETAYTGSNAPCGSYSVASADININPVVYSYEITNNTIDHINNELDFDYSGTGNSSIYTTEFGGTKLANFNGTGSLNIPLGSITDVTGNNYSVWVEEVAQDSGIVNQTQPVTGTMEVTNSSMMFTVYKDVTLKSVKIYAESYSGVVNNAIALKIMGTTVVSTGLIADKANVKYTGTSTSINFTNPGAIITIPINVSLTGSSAGETYWLGFGATMPASVKIKYYTGASFPYADDIDGATVKINQADENTVPAGAGEYGYFYDWEFIQDPEPCDRQELLTVDSFLPIELISLKANKKSTGVSIEWETASEENNDYFTLYRSNDGINFIPIAQIQGAGTTSGFNNYSYFDESVFYGTTYYQLVQSDFNGTTTSSQIVSTQSENSNFEILKYTNEISSDCVFEIELSENSENNVTITNMLGAVMYQQIFRQTSFERLELQLLPGVYSLINTTENSIHKERFVVK